jgi:hypothetical protein
VTVHSTGFGWWRQLVDRYDWQIFRRVTKVSLEGPTYTSDLLPRLAQLRSLRTLELVNTSISRNALEAWQKQNPRVAVTARFPAAPEDSFANLPAN